MGAKYRRGIVAVAAGLLLSSIGISGQAAAVPAAVRCGSVITADTTLTSSLGPCARGLVIGADNITLDLNGFRVFGSPARTGDGAGILVSGRTGVTIRNGSVTDFDAGVAIVDGSSNTVTEVVARDNVGSTKRGSFGDGIVLRSSDGNTIRGNDVIRNGPLSGIAVVGASDSNLIEDNVVSESRGLANGIRIEGPGATNNTLRANTVTANGLDGIAVFADQQTGLANSGNVIDGNIVAANGFGSRAPRPGAGVMLFPTSNNTVVHANQASDNAGSGVLVQRGSLSNLILDNSALGNARLSGFDLEDANGNCDANVWSGNVFGTANQACTTL